MEELRHLSSSSEQPHLSIPRKPLPSQSWDRPESSSYHRLNTEQQARKGKATRQYLSQPFNEVWHYAWTIELLSVLLAGIALAAIVITLLVHEDKPQPQWPKVISINTLVAIFTAILKAALMVSVAEGLSQLKWHWFRRPHMLIDMDRVDQASRGPWGSLKLLFTTYKNYLAVFGALITVVALAIDPFSQQVIQYYSCQQPVGNVLASVPRTNQYSVVGYATSAKDSTLDSRMAAALYTGLISPPANASSSVSVGCPTGNCTFPEANGATHQSLAMCSSCKDLSASIKSNASYNHSDSYVSDYRYYLPAQTEDSSWAQSPAISLGDQSWLSTNVYTPSYSHRYISAFDALMYRSPSCANLSSVSCTYTPFAVGCEVYPCVKTYHANVSDFILNERVLDTIRVPTFSYNWNYTLVTPSGLSENIWQDCKSSDQPTKTNSAPVMTGTELANGSFVQWNRYYPPYCVWQFDSRSSWALRIYFKNYLFGGTITSSEVNTAKAGVGTPWLLNLLGNGNASVTTASNYIEALANSMTGVIRSNGVTQEKDFANGTAFSMQTCIKVRWAWLSLPAVLIVFGMLFLGATIWESRRISPGSVWKSSSLAVVFHGLDGRRRSDYGQLNDLKDMKDTAKDIRVRLEAMGGEDGWEGLRSTLSINK